VVDIRSEEDYKNGTLPGAINLPAISAFDPPSQEYPFGSLKGVVSYFVSEKRFF
jgi:rhodanese-related sulfurtransferase